MLGVGLTVMPTAESPIIDSATTTTGSKVSGFTTSAYLRCTSAGGTELPQLGPNKSVVVLLDDVTNGGGYFFASEQTGVNGTKGFRLSTTNGGGTSARMQLETGGSTKISARIVNGRCAVSIACDGTGRYKMSVNGYAVEDFGVITYTATSAGDSVAIGVLAWSPAVGFNFTNSVCEIVCLDRALSDSELVTASGIVNADNRTVLPATLIEDATTSFWWRSGRHWDGTASTSVSGGLRPVTFTKTGGPVQSLVTETRYSLRSQGNVQDSIVLAQNASYVQRNSFARTRFTTSATRIAVDVVAQSTATSGFGLFNGGTLVGQYLPAVQDGAVKTIDLTLPAGANKTIDLYESGYQGSSGNVAIVAVRQVDSNQLTLTRNTRPARRLVVYGDSIVNGVGATNVTSQGWTMLVRADYTGGISVYGGGSQGLFDHGPDAASRAALARLLVQMASDSAGPRTLWIEMGTNDYGGSMWSAANFGAAYQDLLTKLKALDSGLTIYAQSPTVRTSEVANSFGDTLPAYRTAIQNACTAVGGINYIDGSTIITTGSLADTVHPNTAGHATIKAFVKTTLGY